MHLCTATVCPYLQLTYGLSADAVQGLRAGSPLPGARHTAARILLFLDGFDELQAEEGGEVPTRDTRLRLRNLYATVCGAGQTEAWSPDVLRVVVTSRESRFNGRADERAVCGAHRRRVLLPFNQQQVHCWAVVDAWTVLMAALIDTHRTPTFHEHVVRGRCRDVTPSLHCPSSATHTHRFACIWRSARVGQRQVQVPAVSLPVLWPLRSLHLHCPSASTLLSWPPRHHCKR